MARKECAANVKKTADSATVQIPVRDVKMEWCFTKALAEKTVLLDSLGAKKPTGVKSAPVIARPVWKT